MPIVLGSVASSSVPTVYSVATGFLASVGRAPTGSVAPAGAPGYAYGYAAGWLEASPVGGRDVRPSCVSTSAFIDRDWRRSVVGGSHIGFSPG